MYSQILKIAKISTELFILLFGIWTIASNLAVVFQIPFKYLGLIFILLFITSIIILIFSGFFNEWTSKGCDNINTKNYSAQNLRLQLVVFIAIVIMLLIVVLYTNKPCVDDAHYLRTSVDMVDHPDKSLLRDDALGLFENAPLFICVYKSHAIESICAQISTLTGLPVIYIFHYLLPIIGIFISVMVYLLLFRRLLPEKALIATIVSFVLMYLVSLQTFSINVFTKIHEGKGVLLASILPFIILYGLKSSVEYKARNWLLLGLGQVCAIGLNSTALWLAPVVAYLSVLAGSIGSSKKQIAYNLGYSILSSVYVLVFGLFIIINFYMPPFYITRYMDALALLQLSFNQLFHNGIIFYCSLFIVLFSWLFAPNKITKAITIIFPVFLILLFFNPLFIDLIANNIVSERVYWRVAWIIPLQIFLGIIGVSFLYHHKKLWLKYVKLALVISLVIAFAFNLPDNNKFTSFQNIFEVGAPTLKVSEEYYTTKKIKKLLSENDILLSPEDISIWISTMHRHPQTLIYRIMIHKRIMEDYLDTLEQKKPEDLQKFRKWASWYLNSDYSYPISSSLSNKIRKLQTETGIEDLEIFLDYEFKLAMKFYISGRVSGTNIDEHFAEGLNHYKVTAVCMPVGLKWRNEVIEALDKIGFKKIDTIDEFELWKRT